MPRAIWGWFRIISEGAAVGGGPEWEGRSFHKGRLYSPEDWGGFTAGELRSWPYLQAQVAELKRIKRELEQELECARQGYSEVSAQQTAS